MRPLDRPLRRLLWNTVVAVSTVVSPIAAFSQSPDTLRPAVLPAGAADLGPLPASQSVSLTIHLAPSAAHEVALEQFVSDVATTGSPSWHRWVTPAQFGAQFGPDAAAVAAVTSYLEANGLAPAGLSAAGTRLTVSGSVTQVEAAFAPGLHSYAQGSTTFYANTAAVAIPTSLRAYVLAIDGFSTATNPHPLTLEADGVAATPGTPLGSITAAVEANTARVLALNTTACAEDFDSPTRAAMELLLREAAAQGQVVLAASGCGSRGSAGLPSIFPEVAAVALGTGIVPSASTVDFAAMSEPRPAWQQADGLPVDALRHEPDVTASSLEAFGATMQQILAREPANPDGTPARLGNIAATLYALRMTRGLYTQPDDTQPDGSSATKTGSALQSAEDPATGTATAAASGKWETATGLGVVSMARLAQVFPAGASANNVQITIDNPGATHGQNITFTANVTNTSGNSALAAPTGTINFVLNTGQNIGSGMLTNGTYAVTTNQLAAGSYTVVAQYSGDANYQSGTSVTDSFSVSAEASQLSASAPASTAVGQMIVFTITDTSASGVGTPSGTVSVVPQYLASPPTYTGTLSGSSGTATATVQVPATQAGYVAFHVNCTSADPSFTCYNTLNASANVIKGTSTTALSVSPSNPAAGQSATFTATVTGAGGVYPVPTGSVTIYDYATAIGTANLDSNGVAMLTVNGIVGSYHSFTANYTGDANYNTSNTSATSSGATATSTALSINPNPPVSGSTTTLSATLTYSGATVPGGTMTFYEDGAQIGQIAVTGATTTFTSTSISGTAQHSFYALYSGDANYQNSQSSTITTQATNSTGNATTGTLTVSPNPPVAGNTTTLVDTIHYTSPSGTTTAPTGSVTFYEDGAVIGSNGVNNGASTFTSTTLNAKSAHSFYAVYAGDNTFSGDTSNTVATVASASATTVTVAANPTTVATGSTTTLTATVTSTSGGSAPTGTVTFTSSLQGILGTANLAGNTATLSPTLTTAGTQSITATYNGDTNYNTQASATQASVTVGPASAVTISVSPTTAAYGSTVTLTATATGTPTSGAGPTGTINLTLYGTVTATASVQLTATSGTTATGSTTITAPTPGSYNVQATCTGTNFNCANVQVPAVQLVVNKANTTTSLTSNPASPTAGQSVTYTATVAPFTASGGTAPTGTVTFSVSGANATTVGLTGSTATLTTTLPGNATSVVTAAYNGDNNYNSSSSTGSTVSQAPPVPSVTTVSANPTTGLAGSYILLTANVTASPTTANPAPGAPVGTVSFFDTINGQMTPLGTATATVTGPLSATAQLSTVGLGAGIHSIVAVYSGGTNATASTAASAVNVSLSDYSISVSPSSLTLQRGKSGSAILTVTAINGFNGTVALACTPPSGSATTCSFTPSAIGGAGASTLVITTTQSSAVGGGLHAELKRATTVMAAGLLLACFLPGVRRCRPRLLVLLVASLAMLGTTGCTTLVNNSTTTSPISGTPIGGISFTIATTGTQNGVSVSHNTQFNVTVTQ
jgi:hypothetical protein